MRIELWMLNKNEWSWRWSWQSISEYGYMKRSAVSTKAAALIAQDRLVNREIFSRGLPSHYGSNKK